MDNTELLRFTTAGSVDDGKSTLIGRLLYDTKLIMEDQLEALQRSSDITGDGQINLANLTDGLRAEREQGITIDVAYRYFATPKRKFIVADTPGHVQYTRNMVTGASTANLAIILVDARQGVIQQTRRHAYIASLLRIPHVVICINKMDLVAYSEDIFNQIREDFVNFAAGLGIRDLTFIPISALHGDNIVDKSENLPWYFGPPLLRHLEDVYIGNDRNLQDARFPVQYVIRPYKDEFHDFRGFAGQIAGGFFRKGDPVTILPSGKTSTITQIHTHDGELDEAFAPMSVTLQIADDIDISRGDMIVKRDNIPHVAQEFEAMVCWMVDEPMRKGGKYGIKLGTRSARAMPMDILHRINIDTLEPETGVTGLALNEIGRVKFKTTVPMIFDPYNRNRYTGGFILIDEATNITVGAGMICEPKRIVPGTEDTAEFII
ncbi:MAG TPA: sulfate adenylyltransferase subunit CysN [Kiritimatiellia bacterium]|nr:sulfate adenylyltransferase subunit CysN [Kiritimatiellia bacterium]HMO99113.1 sulfate adenylyltransferase subunit CysN [Kiritimatiellia bacterium]